MPPSAPISWKKVDENQVNYFIWPYAKSLWFLICSVKISIVLVDNSGKPIDALDSEKLLEESGSVEVLKQTTGLEIASVSPLNSDPRQQPSQEGRLIAILINTTKQISLWITSLLLTVNFMSLLSLSGPNIGMVVGVVVGTVLVIVLVAAVVIAVLMFVRRKRDTEDRKQQ